MDVFVIPVGPDRYELYCEQPFTAEPATASVDESMTGRIKRRFEDLLRRAEQWESPAVDSRGLMGRLHDKAMAWVAERVVEQRLLWNLRRETIVGAIHPDDLSPAQARNIVYRALEQDAERHQYWVWVDGILFVVTFVGLGPLFLLIPGVANLPALYFGFRTAGHWYSRGGAKHGLQTVTWTTLSSPSLTELRQIATLPSSIREGRVDEIAVSLGLQNLGSFYDRVSKASL